MNIKELSKKSGLTAHTLRYYEKIGIIRTVPRDPSGHRSYTERDLNWIEFIKKLKSTGMSIANIRKYALWLKKGDTTTPQRQELLENHQVYVEQQLEQWQENLVKIKEKIAFYQNLQKSP